MPDEVSAIHEIKTTSDGNVKISIEKYNELLEKIASQKSLINRLNERPPVINRTIVNKTEEMVAQELRIWGGSLMGLGGSMFVVGAILFKVGRSKS